MKKLAKTALSLAIAAMLMIFAACTAQQPASEPQPEPPPQQQVEQPQEPALEPAPVEVTADASNAVKRVGVSMPTQSLQRWNQDGSNMRQMLLDAGYEVDLQFGGDNEVPVQISQIENMIASGVDVLVIAAIDGDSMTEVLATAEANNIPVISYDRLIMGTSAVTYYATFDNWLVGEMQGNFIIEELGLDNTTEPVNVEFFTGDPGDNNINFFFGGAISVLQPYMDSGVINTPSGQTDIMSVATVGWSTENAQNRMENIISANGYSPTGVPLHAVMCSNDSTAQGVTTALVNAGYTADNFPIITGQDADIISVINLTEGLQAMTVFKDTRILAAAVVEMVDAILMGAEPPINDRETYDNGTGIIPSFLCEPIIVTIDNYRELLIDSGYYTEDQIRR